MTAASRLPSVAAALAVLWIALEAAIWATVPDSRLALADGFDYNTYMGATRDWMAGRGFYEAYQVAGPYDVVAREVLYPPTILPLLVPFTVLPGVLWWAVPALVTAAMVAHWRPRGWTLAAVLWCVALPASADAFLNGNPVLWVVAAAALATRWPAVGSWVLLKPTFAPFALRGIRARAWWVGLAALVAVSLAFLPMWHDYLVALSNARWTRDGGPLYTIVQAPLVAAPIVAWLGSTSRSRS